MGDLLSVCRGRSEGTPYPPSSAPPVAPPAHEDAACAVDAGRHEHGQAPEPKRVETFDADEEAAANNEEGQVEAEGSQPVQPEPSPTPPPEQQAFVVKKEPAQPEQPKQSSMASEDKPNGGGGGGPPPRSFSITLDPSADDLAGSTSKPKVFQMKDGDLGVSSGDESDYDASNATRVNNAAALLGSPADDGNDSSQSAGSTRKGPPPMILYSPRSSPKSVASSSSESETESETESEAEDDDDDDEDEAPKPVAASASAAASGGGSDSDGEAPAARRSMPPSQSGDQLASNGLPDPSALASPETEPRKRRGFNLTISTSKEDTASPAGGKKKKKRPGALNLSLPMTKPTLIRTPTVETPRLFRDKTEDGRPKFNQYIALKTIGRGMFGKVKLVEDENTGWKYAMKIMSKSGLQRRRGFGGPNSWDMVKLEVAIMKKLFHENVVRLFEVIDDSEADKLLLVMEFVKCGAVMDAKIDSEPLDIALAHSYFRELISGLEYLHSQGVIHRDIKPENLLVTEDGHLKITDFGVASKFTGEDAQLHDTAGSAAFMAPEICRGDDDFSGKATDLWAAGVTLFMFVTGRPPWVRQGIHKLHEAIINDPIDLPDGMDEQLADLLTGMLRKEADARLQLEDIKKHPWITQNGKWPMPDLDESEIHKATINEADLSNALSTAEDKDKSGDDADDNSD